MRTKGSEQTQIRLKPSGMALDVNSLLSRQIIYNNWEILDLTLELQIFSVHIRMLSQYNFVRSYVQGNANTFVSLKVIPVFT